MPRELLEICFLRCPGKLFGGGALQEALCRDPAGGQGVGGGRGHCSSPGS